jgi:hypothetical protein
MGQAKDEWPKLGSAKWDYEKQTGKKNQQAVTACLGEGEKEGFRTMTRSWLGLRVLMIT